MSPSRMIGLALAVSAIAIIASVAGLARAGSVEPLMDEVDFLRVEIQSVQDQLAEISATVEAMSATGGEDVVRLERLITDVDGRLADAEAYVAEVDSRLGRLGSVVADLCDLVDGSSVPTVRPPGSC